LRALGVWVAKRIYQITLLVILQHRWSLLADQTLLRLQISAIHGEDVVVVIHTNSADSASYPGVRQRLGPSGIDFVGGHRHLRARRRECPQCQSQSHYGTGLAEKSDFLLHSSSLKFT